MPKVSVIVPNYNHAIYLRKRIDTIISQTYRDIEIIILDDCSTDNSCEIIKEYASKDSRISTFFNKENSGSTFKQWNKGVSLAKGEYIWIAESDDWAENNLLSILIPKLDNNTNIGIAYCQSYEIDEINNRIFKSFENDKSWDSSRMNYDFQNHGKDEIVNYLLFRNTIPNASAVVFRKKIYQKAGLADENMKLCGDWLQWVKMLTLSDIIYVSTPFNYFRQHEATVRTASERQGQYMKERYQIVEFIKNHAFVPDKNLKKVFNQLLKKWMFHTKMKDIGREIAKFAEIKTIDTHIYRRFIKIMALRIAIPLFARIIKPNE